ncbi:MAG: hypothetical protein R3A44_22420 [Caldilineaceae bacterium]
MKPQEELNELARARLAAIRHEEADRVPIDIGGTGVTNINLIAYGNLKRHLGLTEGRPRLSHLDPGAGDRSGSCPAAAQTR